MKKIRERRILLKIFVSSFILFGILFFSFHAVEAASLVPCDTSENLQACTLCHLVIGFKNIFDYLISSLFVVFTLGVVIAGMFYMVSSGNKSLIEKAKTALTYSLMGAVIALTSWLLVNAVLNALGYKNAGSWYNFTCDTTPSKGPGTLGPGGSTLPPSGISGKGRDIQVPQDGSKLAQVLEKYKGAVYVNYTNNPNGPKGWVDGVFYGDCSSFDQAIYKEAYGIDIPRTSSQQGNEPFNYSQLMNGTILESPGHIGIYYNGSVYHNSGTGNDVRVVELGQYLSNHNVTEMRLPPA
ncbi:MAG: hypothetical protein COZ87_03375 [Candidatus Moranbacteria bacterium CG_4_8_14_3_um_filter_43_15]|nr:MAG: hypothetical protein COW51_00885 [Candidatus Moranbacteria bacterium CG17_big_fil_post_rev_8_21_14_2_50_44_12]PIW93061.1 MAG: hypothetical protein COZ87_03375 [Candidatus Moranbacteria bacterium CG_4_8_14_3_um_filter_43_15]PJA85851.1 MAG: hypothetical protein CO142_02635 [Candidatus Moranbacteria bacterium CG_4_9_14_3_um_filter_44_28]